MSLAVILGSDAPVFLVCLAVQRVSTVPSARRIRHVGMDAFPRLRTLEYLHIQGTNLTNLSA